MKTGMGFAVKIESEESSSSDQSDQSDHNVNDSGYSKDRKPVHRPEFTIRCKRVSGRQLDLLLEYLNSHKKIAVAHNRSLESKEYSKQRWKEIAQILNSQGDGTRKDWKGWSKYWVDYKAKLKKRISTLRASQAKNDDGAAQEPPLTDVEAKFLKILANDSGQGLSGEQEKPFGEPSQNGATGEGVNDFFDDAASHKIRSQEISALETPVREQTPEAKATVHPPQRSPQLYLRLPKPASPPLQPSSATDKARSPRRKRRKQELPPSQYAIRRALIHSQEKADAAKRTARALERIASGVADAVNILRNIERSINATSVPRAPE